MMTQFHKDNIGPEWQDLIDQFPQFFLDPSPYVLECSEKYGGDNIGDWPKKLEDCMNLRYGFECGLGWKELLRTHFLSIANLIEEAHGQGHEIHYKGCILKQKFGTCRDQGDFYGPDTDKYWKKYMDITQALYDASLLIDERTGDLKRS